MIAQLGDGALDLALSLFEFVFGDSEGEAHVERLRGLLRAHADCVLRSFNAGALGQGAAERSEATPPPSPRAAGAAAAEPKSEAEPEPELEEAGGDAGGTPVDGGLSATLSAAFEKYDRDHSGELDGAETRSMMRKLGLPPDTLADFDLVFTRFDTDASGSIGRDEFNELHAYVCARALFRKFDRNRDGPSRAKSASRSLRRALLTPQANPGSLYRCGKRT